MRPASTAYAAAAVATSVGTLMRDDRIHALSKYAIAPLAALDVATRPRARDDEHRSRTAGLIAALAGSAVGDHFMLGESRAHDAASADAAMRRGASAFAIQQIGFLALMAVRGQRFRQRPTAVCAATLAGLAVVDAVVTRRESHAPGVTVNHPANDAVTRPERSLTLPDPVVAAYGALLTAMAALAQDDARTARGGRVFLASDAVIVARRLLPHGVGRRAADAVVMATYTAALKLLVDGLADA